LKRNIPKKVVPVKTDLINPSDPIKNKDLKITHLRVLLPALVYAFYFVILSCVIYHGIKKNTNTLLGLGVFLLPSLIIYDLSSYFIFSPSKNSKTNPYSISSPYTRYVSSLLGISKYWIEEIFYMSSFYLGSLVFTCILTSLVDKIDPPLSKKKKDVIMVPSILVGPILLLLTRLLASKYYEWFILVFGILYIGVRLSFYIRIVVL
jgi:hypothetical protein